MSRFAGLRPRLVRAAAQESSKLNAPERSGMSSGTGELADDATGDLPPQAICRASQWMLSMDAGGPFGVIPAVCRAGIVELSPAELLSPAVMLS